MQHLLLAGGTTTTRVSQGHRHAGSIFVDLITILVDIFLSIFCKSILNLFYFNFFYFLDCLIFFFAFFDFVLILLVILADNNSHFEQGLYCCMNPHKSCT